MSKFEKQNISDLSGKLTEKLKDLPADIGAAVNGFTDIGKDLIGKGSEVITTAFNGAFGKMKRLKFADAGKITDGVLEVANNAGAQVASNTNKDKGKDWRVSLSVPPRIQEYMAGGSLLDPLIKTDMKLVFPFTPTVLVGHSANYNPMQPVQTNYPYYAYENSRVDQMTITADFYVQNEFEAKYWVAAIHYLRTMTKMTYGKGPDKGQPPPICYLNGYGDYTFNNVPVIITNFQFDLKREIDYISTGLSTSAPGTEKPRVPDAVAGTQQSYEGYAWAPSESLITVGISPQYSRTQQSKFNLKQFVKGKNTLGGDGFI